MSSALQDSLLASILGLVRDVQARLPSHPDPNTSVLSPHQTAIAIALAFSAAYVAPFYILPSLRTSAHISRNNLISIRARCRAVYTVCALCTAVTLGVHLNGSTDSAADLVLSRLGVWPVDVRDAARTLALLVVLFLGPLYEELVADGSWRSLSPRTVKATLYDTWAGWRNYVVGPASEELIFRSLNVSLLLRAGVSGPRIVLEAPFIFGLAHVHHLNEFIISHRGRNQSWISAALTPRIIIPALLTSFFQLCFTTLFGMFATFVYLRTGNVWSCLVAHTFCNLMGLPRVWGRVGQSDSDDHGQANHQLGLGWSVAYYVLLVTGAVSFYLLLWPLTESGHKLTMI